MADTPRILVLTGAEPASIESGELVRAASLPDALARLQRDAFAGLYVSARDAALWQEVRFLLQHEKILEVLGEGIALINLSDLRIAWANSTFEHWCGGPMLGRGLFEALGTPTVLGPGLQPLDDVLKGICVQIRLQRRDQYLELRLAPIHDTAGGVRQLICLCRDVTSEVRKQLKLDALHQAGRELACLQSDLSPDDRIAVLKHNIRNLTYNLLHYDVIEIRLLEPKTGLLKPLFAEGMTAAAAARVLYAKTEDNGVTGYVAATGATYVCNDTARDPRYLEGAHGARSSLTIALHDANQAIIGTFNVESPQADAFNPQNVQFAEIFCRELSSALHTLDLLVVEQQAMASESIETINLEVSIPVDEILSAATGLLERGNVQQESATEALNTILASARRIKESIMRVNEEMAPQKPLVAGNAELSRLGLRVLVIDKDERCRKAAHSLLGRLGCIVETAATGTDGILLAKHGRYDALVSDIRLPDLTGYEMFLALRQAQPTANVILMTEFGYDATHAIVKSKKDGLRQVLYKPFNDKQMLTALRNAPPSDGGGRAVV